VASCGAVYLFGWIGSRLSHSETDDAFVEAHIVNVAPEAVSGHIVRFMVDENDRVEQGQVLAEIDPVPYRDKVELARSKVEGAETELRRQEAGNDQVKEIELLTAVKQEMVKEARRGLTAAEDELKYTVIRAPFKGGDRQALPSPR
jgi:multidrug resistance efflux pump